VTEETHPPVVWLLLGIAIGWVASDQYPVAPLVQWRDRTPDIEVRCAYEFPEGVTFDRGTVAAASCLIPAGADGCSDEAHALRCLAHLTYRERRIP
jgi:hypothetical protein